MDKKTDLKMEVIAWADAESIDNWESVEDLNPDWIPIIYSIGFVLKESPQAVVMSLNFDSTNDKASCIMLIPKAMIRKRWEVRYAKADKSGSKPSRR